MAERPKDPEEIDWCHIHRVARESRGCDQCLEESGGYTTHIYVPKDSASELAQLRTAIEQEVERLEETARDFEDRTLRAERDTFDYDVADHCRAKAEAIRGCSARLRSLLQDTGEQSQPQSKGEK